MILLNLVQHLTFADVISLPMGHSFLSGIGNWDWSHWNASHLAALFNTDVFAGTRAFFNNFLKSGQAWALAIGVVFGYIFRALTTYG